MDINGYSLARPAKGQIPRHELLTSSFPPRLFVLIHSRFGVKQRGLRTHPDDMHDCRQASEATKPILFLSVKMGENGYPIMHGIKNITITQMAAQAFQDDSGRGEPQVRPRMPATNRLQPAAYIHLSAPDGRGRHLPDRQKLPHQCRDDRRSITRHILRLSLMA
jgi:hypothetical protein